MKIIFIPHLPTLYGRRYNLAKSLAKQGHEVHFIVWDMPYPLTIMQLIKHCANSLKKGTYKQDNLIIHKVRRLPLFWPFINGSLFKYQIKKIYNLHDVNLIISQAFTNETVTPKNLPLVYDMNDNHMAFANIYGSWFYKLGFKFLSVNHVIERQCRQAILVSVVSDKLFFIAKKFNSNVVKVPNGVEEYALHVKQQKVKKHSIIYVSTFGKWSQVIEVMNVIGELKNQLPDIHLDLVGDGTEIEAAKQKAEELGLKKWVTIHGKISNRVKLFDLIAMNDVCLNISEKNAFRDAASPIKVIEYSALGKKVVSTDINEVKALEFPNIFIYSEKSFGNSLQETIINAFKSKIDTSGIRNIIKKAYTWDHLSKELILNLNGYKNNNYKIFHVAPYYPPHLGGLQQAVKNLANAQSKNGLRVSVITSNKPKIIKKNKYGDCVEIIRLKTIEIGHTPVMPFLLIELLFKIKKDDIVHVHFAQFYASEVVALYSKLTGHPFILHYHGDVQPTGPLGRFLPFYKKHILRFSLNQTSAVIFPSKDFQERIINQFPFLENKKYYVVPNGIELPKKYHRNSVDNKFLSASRLSKIKNIDLIIEAFVEARKKSNDIELYIAGNGSEERKLIKIVNILKANSYIHFLGNLTHDEIKKYYIDSSVLLVASQRESFGLSIVEAMSYGLPVIAFNAPGVREIVKNNHNGLLINDFNKFLFANSISKLAKKSRIRENFSLNAIEGMKHFEHCTVAKMYDPIYKGVNFAPHDQ
jgi:glycosyltransferase involved in cell wall biosynthesis